jgi:NAD(P)-dependent dehydrogenase (short-subunit alcohol dehydrogenase family)
MKKILIFGATGGLGKEILKRFNDFDVTGLGSSDLNITDFKSVYNFFNKHNFDIIINFAGINFDKFLHKITDEDLINIDEQINVNIKGTINIISNSLINMRKNNFGRIILISSVLAEKPVVSTGIYSGCKGFLDSFSKTVALENANKNISCNTIQLGYFDGGMTYKIPEYVRENILNSIPSKRWGQIDELENTIRFLINTPYVNGTNLKINGGIDF